MTRANTFIPSTLREASGTVYHYTSAQGLLGILESKRLRASEASGLNDLAEVRQGWQLIKDWVSAQTKSDATDLIRELAEDPLEQPHEVFVLSASTSSDDANQWRLYGDGGSGYVLGFDASSEMVAVSDVPAKKPKVTPGRPMLLWSRLDDIATATRWYHVLYTATEAHAALDELAQAIRAAYLALAESPPDPETAPEAYEEIKYDAYEALARIAHLIKAPGFQGENEVRIVTTFLWVASHIHYRPSRHGVVGYIELTARSKNHSSGRVVRPTKKGKRARSALSLVSVTLGPLLPEEHVSTVQSLLRKWEFTASSVECSSVPLR